MEKIGDKKKKSENKTVVKENILNELFGALKFNEPTEKILRELRRKESKFT